ncbi:MAG: hypothetical protein HQL95_02255 [Magnetococcales bacterium]|nr:hypothetical protein [Magnetococcales bacterium]
MNTQYLIERAKEPSTWRGIAMCATAFGVYVSPDMMNTIIAAGTGIAGLIGVVTSDPQKESGQ